MRFASHLRLVKYIAKSAALARAPAGYWSLRQALRGWHEPELGLLSRFANPARAAFDIGAHFGMWSAAMLPHFREVHAFEPLPRLARVLRAGWGDRVTVHEVALSRTAGSLGLRVPIAGLGRSTVEPGNTLEGLRDRRQPIVEMNVRSAPLDDLALPDPALIKIDVEGHELAVIDGAMRTIATARPALIVEVEARHAPGTAAALFARLESLGYSHERIPGSRNIIFTPVAP